jgi:N-formylglutamate deformylase
MASQGSNAFFVTIPHSGEFVPSSTPWLSNLPEVVLMRDVDQLYQPAINDLQLSHIIAHCHRYVIDLNRKPEEFDADAVTNAPFPSGSHPKGLHWSVTTFGEKLIPLPMTMELHHELVRNYYEPFHQSVLNLGQSFKKREVFHLDLHSMPSQGTAMHTDPGQKRADIVVSDFHGKSSRKDFVDLIQESYQKVGFSVAYNWPYFGGGITQMYGRPEEKHHTVQVELNRATYMNEDSKQKVDVLFTETQKKLAAAMERIVRGLKSL